MDKNELKKSVIQSLQEESKAIMSLSDSLDWDQITSLYCMIKNCSGKIILSGCGTSGEAAKKISHTLSCVRRPAFFLSPSDALHGGLGVAASNDIAILISKGGHTEELEKMIDCYNLMGIETILISENQDSSLKKKSNFFCKVYVAKEPDPFNMLATASTLSVIAVFDAIAIALQKDTGFSKKEFLEIHPGGDVGERLLEDVGK